LNINRSHVSPAEACHTLIKAANAAGGEDNITAILIEMDVK
jgi:serine/threonine protein phosphatase PrpC